MLIEDIHTGIVPFSYDDYKSASRVFLEPASQNVENLICKALPTHYGRSDDLRGMVCGFIRYATHVLSAYGQLQCEIVYFYNDKDKTKPVAFELSHLPHGIVRQIMGIPFYLTAVEDEHRDSGILNRIRRIDASRLFTLEAPSAFGSPRSHRRLISRLARLGQSVMPSFALEEMKKQNGEKLFDFKSYRRSYELWIASVTRHLGWTARGTFREGTTEYYRLVRHLRMNRQRALLRNHILSQLNDVLIRIGSVIGFKGQIRMEGLSNPEKFDDMLNKLAKGELAFMEAWKAE